MPNRCGYIGVGGSDGGRTWTDSKGCMALAANVMMMVVVVMTEETMSNDEDDDGVSDEWMKRLLPWWPRSLQWWKRWQNSFKKKTFITKWQELKYGQIVLVVQTLSWTFLFPYWCTLQKE